MQLHVRLFLILATVILIALSLSEQPQTATAISGSDLANDPFCVGVVEPTGASGPQTMATSQRIFTVPGIASSLFWETIFRTPASGPGTGLSPTAEISHSSAPVIMGLPEDKAPAPLRALLGLAQTVDVTVGANNISAFAPKTVTITAGDTVQWIWEGNLHTVTSGMCCDADGQFCSPSNFNCETSTPSNVGDNYSRQFNTAGTFQYFCQVHGSAMTGTVIVNAAPTSSTFQFSAGTYSLPFESGIATVTVTRSGSGSGTVDFATSDGTARQSSDYTIASGTLSFADGETSKSFTILVTDDAYVEGNETVNLTLSNPTGVLGNPATAILTITDNDTQPPTTNPIDVARTFVYQHYLDFLSREPDQAGLDFWTNEITKCGSDATCIKTWRVIVSNAFFYEAEFQQTGAYVYRLYRASFGNDQPSPNPDAGNTVESKKIPAYAVFVQDRARVVAGANQAQAQSDLANAFVQRPQFIARYPTGLSGTEYVNALLARIQTDSGANLDSQRPALINLFNQSGRGAVLYRLADDNQTNPINNRLFIDAEYNRSFVYTQYAGYLRRDSDIGGFLFWLNVVGGFPFRDVTGQNAMVCAFITSREYQERFSPIVTHFNSECGP